MARRRLLWPDRRQRRLVLGATVVVAWIVGLVLLIRREYFRPQLERLAEGASRIAPGAVYYAVLQGDRQVGFASSTIDTTENAILVRDYLVMDTVVGNQVRRLTTQTNVNLTRALRLTTFDVTFEGDGAPARTVGRVEGDSVLVLSVGDSGSVDEQRIALNGPVLLSTLVPLAAAVIDPPKVGRKYVIPVFDPARLAQSTMHLNVSAESLVTVHDSATFDSTTGRWSGALPDTLRAWRLAADSASGFSGWIDSHGRVLETTQLGFVLRRLPYEVAFVNWRNDSTETTGRKGRAIQPPRRPKR